MVSSTARLSHALLAVALAAILAEPARAQSPPFPTPAKSLCAGEPSPAAPATCNATTPPNSPAPFVPVFYAITLGPNMPAGSYTLLETLPAGFTLAGASCTVAAGGGLGQTTALASSVSGLVTALGPVNALAGQTLVCFIRGHFNNPGMGVTNSVTVADETGEPVSSAQGHNALVASPAVFPSDLSVTKTVAPTSVDVTSGPQTLDYTIVLKNNGPEAVHLGTIGELFDRVWTSANGVPMQVRLVPGSAQCMAAPSGLSPPNTACLDPVPVGGYGSLPPWTLVTTTPLALARWHFPSAGPNAAGFIPVGGTVTLTYQLQIRRHPDLHCAKGGEALRNEAFFGLTRLPVLTLTESDPTNNTASSPDVQVATGQEADPDCGLPLPGPIAIAKQQISPSASSTVAWNSPVQYRVTLTNSDPSPITVRLRDRVMEWAGTPPFTATVLGWSCTPAAACASAPAALTPAAQLSSYFATATAWDKVNVAVPGSGGSVQLDLTLSYQANSCDSFAAGGNSIRNFGRANYAFGSPAASMMAEAFVDTIMAPTPACNLHVKKAILGTGKVEFGVALTDPNALAYTVSYRNAGSTSVTVGTLIDAIRIVQPNYASQLPFAYSYSCAVTAGAVTGAVPTSASGGGAIVHTTHPSQGARIIDAGPVTFGSNATLACQVKISVDRPPVGDQGCLSSVQPLLENLALMDVSGFYNASLPWPPSATYNPATAPGLSQPTQPTNWHAVSVRLPKCHRLVVNKSVVPTLTWAPGGPGPLTYTVTVTNAGDTLSAAGGWSGLLGDQFSVPSNVTPGSVVLSSTCSNPAATWAMSGGAPAWSGTPAGNQSVLPITSFPAGCSIKLTFTMAGPFAPGQICNRGFVAMTPQNSADWYANVPNAALLESSVCLPVLQTNKLVIRKSLNNAAGVVLPPGVQFPMIVSCQTPAGTTVTSSIAVPLSAPLVVPNLPVGSYCTVQETWAGLPVPGTGTCKPPAAPVWQSPLYAPTQSVLIAAPPAVHVVSVINTLDCVTPPVNTLSVSKTFDPKQPSLAQQLPVTAVFPVQVVCSPSPSAVLNLAAPNFLQVVTNIPVGAACTIAELPPQGTNVPAYCRWVSTYPGGDSLTIPAQGNPALVVQNSLVCNPPLDLAVAKSGPVRIPGTGLYTFTVTVTSPGGPFTVPGGALTLTDIVTGGMGGLAGITVTSGAWTCSTLPSTGTCTYTGTGPTVAGQVLGTFTMYYYLAMPVPYVNCASVGLAASAGLPEADLQNNTACVPGGASRPLVDLAIKKTGPVPVAGSHGLSTFTLTVTNAGGSFTMPANGLAVTDIATAMPGSFTAITATPGGNWSCAVAGATASCLYSGSGTIAAGQVLGTIAITAYRHFSLATFSNCASVALTGVAALLDIYPPNNKACVAVSSLKPASASGCRRPLVPSLAGSGCVCPSGTVQRGEECLKTSACDPPAKLNSRGACECPADMVARGGTCVVWESPPRVEKERKPESRPPAAAECRAPMVASLAGSGCVCPKGTVQRGAECLAPTVCIAPARPDGRGACECPANMVAKGNTCIEWERPVAPRGEGKVAPRGEGKVAPRGEGKAAPGRP